MSNLWDIEITIKGTISNLCFADDVDIAHRYAQELLDTEGDWQTFVENVDIETVKLVEYQLKKNEDL